MHLSRHLAVRSFTLITFMSKSPSHKPIEIKISTVVAVSAIVHGADIGALDAALHEMTGGVADFFEDDLAVLDVADLQPGEAPVDWAALVALLKKYRLNAVAVRNATPDMHEAILAQGLSLDSGKTRDDAPAKDGPTAAAQSGAEAQVMVIDTPVRAGQRIYARGCDLIITAVVNNGAEIIADGSIHVYSSLYGRALAGASGNPQARIFALAMEPELVSIAGVYRTFEDGFLPEMSKGPSQIRLAGDRIEINSVKPVTPVNRS